MPNLGGFKDLELDKGRLSLGFAALPAGRKNAGIKKYLCYSFAFRSLVCTFAATKEKKDYERLAIHVVHPHFPHQSDCLHGTATVS
jgi:hypothetical protein